MQAVQTQQSFAIRPEEMAELIGSILEHRTPSIPIPPPQRFDALVRQTVHSVSPDLNPQPLPPGRFLRELVDQVVSKAETFQEFANLMSAGEQRGIIIVGGYVAEFADEFCGNGFRLTWPHPGPPPQWFPRELDGGSLLIMASQFSLAAKQAYGAPMRETLAKAANKFAETGLLRINAA